MELVHSGHAALAKLISATAKWTDTAARSRPLVWPTYNSLPVAGLDVLTAQTVLYTLKTSLPTDQGAEAVEAWLQTLQVAQIASDRLLGSLSITHQHLSFWRGRLKAGSHGSFMLLSQGPVGFVRELLAMLHEMREAWSHRAQQHTPPAAAAVAAGGEGSEGTPSDRIEERVVALQLQLTRLAEALSAVHEAAVALRACSNTPAKAAAAGGPLPQGAGLQDSALSAVHECLSGLRRTLEQLMPGLEQLQQCDAAARQVQQTLTSPAAKPGSKQQQAPAGVKPVSRQQVQQQLSRVCELLQVQESDLKHGLGRGDVGAALSSASSVAVRLGPLAQVPAWAVRPSALQRHWIKYSIAGAAGVSAAAFLYRHSRLAGSSGLDDWAAAAASAVKGAWADHVVSPLVVVRDELFSTFRDRPSIVSNSEFEADKQSLLRMLAEFQQDHPAAAAVAAVINTKATPAAPTAGPSAASTVPAAHSSIDSSSGSLLVGDQLLNDSDAVNRGMQVVMRCYERDLKSPIRNLVAGELARTLLIQVQRLKLDTEAAMLELDQILRANELSISLVAAVPALLLSWALLHGIWVLLLAPRPPDPKREAMPCRLAMADLERALSELARSQSPDPASSSTVAKQQQQQQQQQQQVSAAEGVVLFRLYRVYREAQVLYRLKDKTSRYSEWPHLQSDLMELVQPTLSAAAKLDLHGRMSRTYTVLKP